MRTNKMHYADNTCIIRTGSRSVPTFPIMQCVLENPESTYLQSYSYGQNFVLKLETVIYNYLYKTPAIHFQIKKCCKMKVSSVASLQFTSLYYLFVISIMTVLIGVMKQMRHAQGVSTNSLMVYRVKKEVPPTFKKSLTKIRILWLKYLYGSKAYYVFGVL